MNGGRLPEQNKMKNIVAHSLGIDPPELSDCRYKSTRTTRAIYAVGQHYYAQGKTAPTDKVGGDWRRHTDQFWAEKAGTVLWVCDAE